MKNWSRIKLSLACKMFADGDWIESKDQSESGIRLVQTGNVGEGFFKDRVEKARFISAETFCRLRCTEIKKGDCLISRLPDPVGRSCIIPEMDETLITAVDCTIVRFDESLIRPKFFNFYSQSKDYLATVESETSGTTRKRISRSRLGEIIIPLPPLPEQRRIVAILDEVFEGLAVAAANTEKNLKNAREVFETYLNSVFAQQGSEWNRQCFGDICENLDSRRIPITKSVRASGKVPYYGASGIVDYIEDHIFDESILLVSEDGANLLARTYPIAFSVSGKCWVNNHAHVVRFADFSTQRFVELFLNSISLEPYVSGMAQPKLNQKSLNSILVPLPEISIRQEVVSKADELSTYVERLETIYQQKLAAIAELKQSILQKAFAGELTKDLQPELETV